MKVLVAHNAYQHAGGEDSVVRAERDMLLREGNEVSEYRRHNDEIELGGAWSRISLGSSAVWSHSTREELHRLLENCRPDVVHFHNTFPLISPAAYYACRDQGVPVVQTLHNYRLFCPAANFFRDGKVCEDCLENGPWQAVRHACYRESHIATATVAAMLSFHHWRGTWTNLVDCYIALSEFSRAKFVEAGLSPKKIIVKPNFVLPDPGPGSGPREYAAFVGRFSEEKGLPTLLKAWGRAGHDQQLRVIGDGPLFQQIQSELVRAGLRNVRLEGRLSRDESLKVMQGARFLILPSTCYENFPMTLAEAYACGTPVIASRLGAMQELVCDGQTGLQFTAGDADDLAIKVGWALGHPQDMRRMGIHARTEFETKYSSSKNYEALIAIYESVLRNRKTVREGCIPSC
jgi:glycosyltransferase involved in cell wall biosynthesis